MERSVCVTGIDQSLSGALMNLCANARAVELPWGVEHLPTHDDIMSGRFPGTYDVCLIQEEEYEWSYQKGSWRIEVSGNGRSPEEALEQARQLLGDEKPDQRVKEKIKLSIDLRNRFYHSLHIGFGGSAHYGYQTAGSDMLQTDESSHLDYRQKELFREAYLGLNPYLTVTVRGESYHLWHAWDAFDAAAEGAAQRILQIPGRPGYSRPTSMQEQKQKLIQHMTSIGKVVVRGEIGNTPKYGKNVTITGEALCHPNNWFSTWEGLEDKISSMTQRQQ
jgi:hypothetical protein